MSTDQSAPMWRLTELMVRSTLVTAWRLAISPTRTSSDLLNATTDGVVRAPSALAMTVGSPPSSTLTTELVEGDRKSTRLNSSHVASSYAVFCLKKKNGTDSALSDSEKRVIQHRTSTKTWTRSAE